MEYTSSQKPTETPLETSIKKDSPQILWNLVNSVLAGALVMLGALVSGNISRTAITAAILTGLVIAITKFSNFWDSLKEDFDTPSNVQKNMFSFF